MCDLLHEISKFSDAVFAEVTEDVFDSFHFADAEDTLRGCFRDEQILCFYFIDKSFNESQRARIRPIEVFEF